MFERFTGRARQVVVLAQEEARALRHNYIGTEHILLGLLREEEGLAARVLEGLGVTVEEVRARVEDLVGRGEDPLVAGEIPFTKRAKKVLELSLREALALRHNYIGTEHVLLGLLRVEKGVGAQILSGFGLESESVRGEVLRSLSPGPSPPRRGWEYKVESIAGPEALTEDYLRPLGAEGWELVAVVGDRLVFKRRARPG
jgi:ATP-dependent Clp protease ATP-binding subunit ClpC